MIVPFRHFLVFAAAGVLAVPCLADEIRLKDGKKLYGVIVAYEENMFKVKTDFGYVLVEKDKIASIVPTTPAGSTSSPEPQAPKNGSESTKASANGSAKSEVAVASGAEATPAPVNASAKAGVVPSGGGKRDKDAAKASGPVVKPALPLGSAAANAAVPAVKGASPTTSAALPTSAAGVPSAAGAPV